MYFDLEALELDKLLKKYLPYATTIDGKDKIMKITPFENYDDLMEHFSVIQELEQAIRYYQELPLGGVYQMNDTLKRASIGGILSGKELLEVSSLIYATSNVIRYIRSLGGDREYLKLKEIGSKLIYHQKLKSVIDNAIDDKGLVVDNASNELFMIRKNKKVLDAKLRSKMNELLVSKAKMLNDNVITIRDDRLCLAVKAEFKNTFKGIIHDESASKTTVYIEPDGCVEISNQIFELELRDKEEVKKILHMLSLQVESVSEELINNYQIIIKFDVLEAIIKFSHDFDYIMPVFNQNGIVDLKKARHPLIDKDKVVPIDVRLGQNYQTIIITGPNTGGKTVTLKTVGLVTIMAMSGLYIPVKEGSKIAFFDNIFTDIGDEQSIEQSLSTFSSHMKKITWIIDNLTINSLILLDELGSGTDPKEGSCLAIALIEYFEARGARIITTTHYSDLKAYAFNHESAVNASVEFNDVTLSPTYRLLIGVPGKSNGILIAKRLGLDERIIERAQNQETNSSDEVNVVLKNIEEKSALLNKKIDEYEALNAKLRESNRDLDLKKKELNDSSYKILHEAKDKANEILLKAQEEANELLKEIRANSVLKENEMADIKHKINNLAASDSHMKVIEEEIKVGDHVYVRSYEAYGTVSKIIKDKYYVKLGLFEMTFTYDELELSNADAKPKKNINVHRKPSSENKDSTILNTSLELDLRGKRFNEVKDLLDTFLDRAYLANIGMVRIIHGFGSGTIRGAVHDYLKKSSYVKEFRLGGEGEGLNGVTIAYLK